MRCNCCQKKMKDKITWRNLFRERILTICDECFFKYPIKITESVFPLGPKEATWVSLFDTFYSFSSICFAFELGRLFKMFIQRRNTVIIYMDLMDYKVITLLEQMSNYQETTIIITLFA